VFVSATSLPVRFRSLYDSTLPGRIGETITIDIEAVDPGKDGNLARNQITLVEGSLADSVSVTNPESTRGGRSTQTLAVSDEDRTRVRSLVIQQLFQRAQNDIQNGQGISILTSEFVPMETLQIALVRSEAYSSDVGEQVSTLSLQMQGVIQGLAIDLRLARQIAYKKLSLSENVTAPLDMGSLVFATGPVTHIDSERRVTFLMEVSPESSLVVDTNSVQGLIVGMTVEQAQTALANRFSPVAKSVLEVWPPFWPFTPVIGQRIHVEVDGDP
jgi:hypothetical protein